MRDKLRAHAPWLVLGTFALTVAAVIVAITPGPSVSAAKPAGTVALNAPTGRVPVVEALVFKPVPLDAARATNASIAYATGEIAPAAPFRFAGGPLDRQAATACLASAVLYEAGDDPGGQLAVAQVVLNRVRHPAFPKSVCGVVFQGSNRSTGCQFTFTCDGALKRTWSDAAWTRARTTAEAMLAGAIDPRVGLATHYHTDWVVPYWSAKLDKIAKVGTHLFFRWRGGWGTARAMVNPPKGVREVVEAKLAVRLVGTSLASPDMPIGESDISGQELAAAQAAAAAEPDSTPSVAIAGVNLRGATVKLADTDTGVFILQLPQGRFSGDHAMASLELCRGRAHCTVLGYLPGEALPKALPLPVGAAKRASFYYDAAVARAYWNCGRITRSRASECIPGTEPASAAGVKAGEVAG